MVSDSSFSLEKTLKDQSSDHWTLLQQNVKYTVWHEEMNVCPCCDCGCVNVGIRNCEEHIYVRTSMRVSLL
jgi:hypothetical protein